MDHPEREKIIETIDSLVNLDSEWYGGKIGGYHEGEESFEDYMFNTLTGIFYTDCTFVDIEFQFWPGKVNARYVFNMWVSGERWVNIVDNSFEKVCQEVELVSPVVKEFLNACDKFYGDLVEIRDGDKQWTDNPDNVKE